MATTIHYDLDDVMTTDFILSEEDTTFITDYIVQEEGTKKVVLQPAAAKFTPVKTYADIQSLEKRLSAIISQSKVHPEQLMKAVKGKSPRYAGLATTATPCDRSPLSDTSDEDDSTLSSRISARGGVCSTPTELGGGFIDIDSLDDRFFRTDVDDSTFRTDVEDSTFSSTCKDSSYLGLDDSPLFRGLAGTTPGPRKASMNSPLLKRPYVAALTPGANAPIGGGRKKKRYDYDGKKARFAALFIRYKAYLQMQVNDSVDGGVRRAGALLDSLFFSDAAPADCIGEQTVVNLHTPEAWATPEMNSVGLKNFLFMKKLFGIAVTMLTHAPVNDWAVSVERAQVPLGEPKVADAHWVRFCCVSLSTGAGAACKLSGLTRCVFQGDVLLDARITFDTL